MILKALFIYVLISQLIVLPYVWWSMENCEDEEGQLAALKSLSGPRKYIAWTAGILVEAILAPFILPWMIYSYFQNWRQVSHEIQELRKLYMEMSLEPLHEANIYDELLEHFESITPSVMTHGFELLGDFYLKEEPYNSKARIFLGHGMSVFVDIGTTMETNYIDLISYLENGDFVSTASIAEFPRAAAFERYGVHVNCEETMDFDVLLGSHLDFLEMLTAKTGQSVRQMDFPRWKEYYHYHNRKFGEARFELGELDEPPENCEFPKALDKSASSNRENGESGSFNEDRLLN